MERILIAYNNIIQTFDQNKKTLMNSITLMQKLTARLAKTFADLGELVQTQIIRTKQKQIANPDSSSMNRCMCRCSCANNSQSIDKFIKEVPSKEEVPNQIHSIKKEQKKPIKLTRSSDNQSRNIKIKNKKNSEEKQNDKDEQFVQIYSKDQQPPNKSKSKKESPAKDINGNHNNTKDTVKNTKKTVKTLKNKPKKARSSLKFFIKQLQQHFKKSSDTEIVVNEAEMIEIAEKKWQQMDDQKRAPYINAQKKDKLRYQRQMQKYYAGHPQEKQKDELKKNRKGKKIHQKEDGDVKKKEENIEKGKKFQGHKKGQSLKSSQSHQESMRKKSSEYNQQYNYGEEHQQLHRQDLLNNSEGVDKYLNLEEKPLHNQNNIKFEQQKPNELEFLQDVQISEDGDSLGVDL